MGVEEQLLLIRNYNLWSDVSDKEYEELNLIHHFIEAKRNEYLYFESHLHNKLYFLKEGYIKIGYIDEQGREVVKEIIRKGEVFGQITLERNNLHGEFAQAYKGDVSLCAFNIEEFERLLQQKPGIALRYSKLVGHQLKRLENRLVGLLHKDVKTRLAGFLLMLMENEAVTGRSVNIPNYLRHEDIASLIGSSRQTVTSTINELEATGLLSFTRSAILIPDVKALQKLVAVG
ncbi:Crp/Fnr family transcriptional regulator [Flavihumibacter sp. UBA7668]|uniref:Crp/Fnr family transcriptional regulator n=1 Tax=Flavihumibacter sp. UBA7668 TaxID=1946542 RepID=UPI0025BFEED3|nr:Crp/Fnr family transcriptional regulator [Flavihumibacter sp. UBA7668]